MATWAIEKTLNIPDSLRDYEHFIWTDARYFKAAKIIKDETKIDKFCAALDVSSAQKVRAIYPGEDDLDNVLWPDFVHAIRQHICPAPFIWSARAAFYDLKQNGNPFRKYIETLREAATIAKFSDKEIITQIMRGLDDHKILSRITEMNEDVLLDDVIKKVEALEKKINNEVLQTTKRVEVNTLSTTRYSRKNPFCLTCKKKEYHPECIKKYITCRNCNKKGHYARDCNKPMVNEVEQTILETNLSEISIKNNSLYSCVCPLKYVEIEIEAFKRVRNQFLVDSGSSVNLIPRWFAEAHCLCYETLASPIYISGVSGIKVAVHGIVKKS